MVVRLREDDLPPLAINHPRYLELRVYSKAPHPHAVMETVRAWLPASPPVIFLPQRPLSLDVKINGTSGSLSTNYLAQGLLTSARIHVESAS